METISEYKCFDGTQGFYSHHSAANDCLMKFAVFVPNSADQGPLPVLTYLAGLTCTEETFVIKAGAQRMAAALGIILVAPDTSPRGEGVADDPDGHWDFGLGAGFYVNSTQAPFERHYQMYDYITKDLQAVVVENFPVDTTKQGIFGHSMGGHGALTIGLKNPDIYASISAFAPICAPMDCPWGQKAFSGYLGDEKSAWAAHDSSKLMAMADPAGRAEILVDQGLSDQFLQQGLHPHLLEAAAETSGYPLRMRRHEGYDHGYYFMSTFMEDHLRHHASILK